MNLILDTNILFSFFRDNPVRFIILNSDFLGIKLFTPDYALEELEYIKEELAKYSKLNLQEIEDTIYIILTKIKVLRKESFEQCFKEAKKLVPHDKDIPFFALALKFDCPIWSNERDFKKQSKVQIFNTEDLRNFLKV